MLMSIIKEILLLKILINTSSNNLGDFMLHDAGIVTRENSFAKPLDKYVE